MNFDKLFHKFRLRLLQEAFLTAFLVAVSSSAASAFAVSLFYHFLTVEAPPRTFMFICPITFFIGFTLTFANLFPTQKKIAARIDETGLQERVSTMLAYRNGENDILRLQRADTLYHLNRTQPSRLKIRPLGKTFLLCLFCILSVVIITRIPYDVWRVDIAENGITDEQRQILEDLLTQLREESHTPAIPDDSEARLQDIINQLESGLKDSHTDLEIVAQLETARQQIENTLDKLLTQHAIGEALQQFELTASLGEAINSGDGNAVSTALLDLKVLLAVDNTLFSTLSQNINDALIDSGVSSEDQLFRALNDFAVDLLKIPDTEDFYTKLSEVIATAEDAILAALANQVATEFQQNLLDSILSDAKDRILGINPDLPEYQPPSIDMPESSGSETPEDHNPGEQPEGEMPDGEMPEGENPNEGQGDGDGSDRQRMIESIYDPISGNVSYGEVFAVYYAEYLKALEAGNIPPDLQEIINQYFSTLDQ